MLIADGASAKAVENGIATRTNAKALLCFNMIYHTPIVGKEEFLGCVPMHRMAVASSRPAARAVLNGCDSDIEDVRPRPPSMAPLRLLMRK